MEDNVTALLNDIECSTKDLFESSAVCQLSLHLDSSVEFAADDADIRTYIQLVNNNENKVVVAGQHSTGTQDEVILSEASSQDVEHVVNDVLSGLDLSPEKLVRYTPPPHRNVGRGRPRGSGRTESHGRAFKCDECGKMVDYYKQERHWRTHSGVRPHACSYCDKRFARSDILQIHERIHTGQRPYQCNECGKRFARVDTLRAHAREHSGDTFQCHDCGKCFTRAERLRSHMRIHRGEKLYSCPECDKSFSRADNLQTHIRVHTGEHLRHSYGECGDCEIQFDENGVPSLRSAETDKPVTDPYVCCVCSRKFRLACRLRAHMHVHSGIKEFTCYVCGKQFALAYRLLLHMRTHTGEKPYECITCGKTFARSHNLTQHMRSHVGEKPYRCEVCGKSYTQTKTLKEHRRIHTGERPYECSICTKKFARIDNLKVHELTHTDNKRHICPVCGKKYADIRCFQKHVASHNGAAVETSALRFPCHTCIASFYDLRSLQAHTEVAHRLDRVGDTAVLNDNAYVCGVCGMHMTVQRSSSSEILLVANCDCSSSDDTHVDMGLVDGVVEAGDLGDVVSDTDTDICNINLVKVESFISNDVDEACGLLLEPIVA